MVARPPRRAAISEAASFDPGTFLENIAVRVDGSMLVTVVFDRELWWIPAPGSVQPPARQLCHTFDDPAMGIVEVEPEVFYVCSSAPGQGALYRIDLGAWSPGEPVRPELVTRFPAPVSMLNGTCAVAPGVLLIADCFAGLIWRVDVGPDTGPARPTVWLAHETMEHRPMGPFPRQPGVNGVQFAASTGCLYYTSTAQQLFLRVAVDPETHDPVGNPELVAHVMMGDDFCVDEQAGLAYITTHRENTIDVVSLTPGENGGARRSIVGDPYNELVTGPSAIAWGRAPEERGVVAYVTTEGGVMSLTPGNVLKPARIVRVELEGSESDHGN